MRRRYVSYLGDPTPEEIATARADRREWRRNMDPVLIVALCLSVVAVLWNVAIMLWG